MVLLESLVLVEELSVVEVLVVLLLTGVIGPGEASAADAALPVPSGTPLVHPVLEEAAA